MTPVKPEQPLMTKAQRRWWGSRLRQLYDTAKRAQGHSLNIYDDVTQMLDYLEELEPIPDGMNLSAACDRIASKLREMGGYSRDTSRRLLKKVRDASK